MRPLGAFDFSEFDKRIGKGLLQALLIHTWYKSERGWYDTTMLGLGTIGIWSPWARNKVAGASGWSFKHLVAPLFNPVTLTITYAYVAGAITAKTIDPDEGLDNYVGFTTGGEFGNTPNYGAYFNVYDNISTIVSARSNTNGWGKSVLEDAYIQAYWQRKEALAHFNRDPFSYYF